VSPLKKKRRKKFQVKNLSLQKCLKTKTSDLQGQFFPLKKKDPYRVKNEPIRNPALGTLALTCDWYLRLLPAASSPESGPISGVAVASWAP
jgi:hypothetical protein